MIKLKNINGRRWIYDLDDAYLMLEDHYIIQDMVYSINKTNKDVNEILEDIENESEYMV